MKPWRSFEEQLKQLQKERRTLEVAYKEITDELEIYDQLETFQEHHQEKRGKTCWQRRLF